MDVFSLKFKECRTIYPLRVIRPIKKGDVDIDHTEQLKCVLNDLHCNDCVIIQFIGDNPKRAIARLCLSHSSWYPCEYGFCKGVRVETNHSEYKKMKKNLDTQIKIIADKIKDSNISANELRTLKNIQKGLAEAEKKLKPKQSNIVWPKSTADGPPRTREEIFEIIQKIENDEPLTSDEAKGIYGRSLFFDIHYFNFVRDIPVDYLHCVCLGVVKRTLELTFKVGESRPRITKRPLSSPMLFNNQIMFVKVPKESNRRVRDLDFSVYKGQEFRNIILFFFPLIINCIEETAKERPMWLYLAYMIRCCVIPTEEFRQVPLDVIRFCMTKFYSLYEALFGARNCTYNTHIVGSHLIEMRYHGPLTLTSAFPFESFYGEIRNSFVPGTNSTLKQIMSNVLIKRAITNHCCEQSIQISVKDTAMECNSLIYCYVNHQYKIYRVVRIYDETLICKEIPTLVCKFRETPTLNWSLIGVFKLNEEFSEEELQEERVPTSSIKGKVILVGSFLITCPTNILIEK